jgi:hypothetical protein
MAYNFVAGDRDQLLLMPPSLAEWLPADHLAWFVLDVVAELDFAAFARSSGAALKMSRSGWLPRTRFLIMRRSLGSARRIRTRSRR